MEVYFDNSATTKVKKEVCDAVCDAFLNCYGNPSSLHRKGVEAEHILKSARETVANELHVSAEDVYFTSCGSEGNNLAIIGTCTAMRKKCKIITSKAEHKSVLESFSFLEKSGFEVLYLDIDKDGGIDEKTLFNNINSDTGLVSLMTVNNETGTITDIKRLYKEIKKLNPDTLVHTDAVQAFGKLNFEKDTADMITVSGHKIGAPKGIGAVYIKKGIKVNPVIYGGGQEKGIRSGTENVPAIAGLKKAIEIIDKEKSYKKVSKIKKYLYDILTLEIPDFVINSPENSSPYILNVSMLGLRSEILLHSLEQYGVYVSSGSACSSNRKGAESVVSKMGYDRKRADSSIRISLCGDNTMEEAEYAVEAFKKVAKANEKIRKNNK